LLQGGPKTGRTRRQLGARPTLRWAPLRDGQAEQPVGWRGFPGILRDRSWPYITTEPWNGLGGPVTDLKAGIRRFIDAYNERCKPFAWTKNADELLTKTGL
jgi:hypothetical protein